MALTDEDNDQETRVNETPDMQIDSTILKLAEERASIDRKRAELNEQARNVADNFLKLGITPAAANLAVRLVKSMTKSERNDFLTSVRRVTKVTGERQAELWPAEVARTEARVERAKEKAAKAGRTKDELDAESDKNPRSNPKKGGAGMKAVKKGAAKPRTAKEAAGAAAKAGDAIINQAQQNLADQEQAEGDAALKAGLPLSQSAQAEAKRAEAKVP